jgi:hypothetical protein
MTDRAKTFPKEAKRNENEQLGTEQRKEKHSAMLSAKT